MNRLELYKCKNLNISLKDWYKNNLNFLTKHKYWTKGASQLYNIQKFKNIEEIKNLF